MNKVLKSKKVFFFLRYSIIGFISIFIELVIRKLLLSFKTYQRASMGVIQILRSIFKVVDYKFALPFREIGESILKNSSDFNRPVLLLHGDTHNHRTYQPFKKKHPYFHAIENYGSPDIKAIEITIRPKSKHPFKVERVFNP